MKEGQPLLLFELFLTEWRHLCVGLATQIQTTSGVITHIHMSNHRCGELYDYTHRYAHTLSSELNGSP